MKKMTAKSKENIYLVLNLIFAVITMALVLGQDGLIAKSKDGGNQYKSAAQDEQNILDDVNSFLDGHIQTIGGSTPSGGDSPSGGDTPQVQEISLSKVLSYSSKSITLAAATNTYLEDLSGNNNFATLYGTSLTQDGKGLVFDGDAYGTIRQSTTLDFPLTIETTFSSTSAGNRIIYFDKNTKTSIGFWSNYISVSIDTDTKVIPYPSDLFDGNLKTITVVYTTLSDFKVYVNGTELAISDSTDSWGGSGFYLGRRDRGTNFIGTLYTLRVYPRALTEEEVQTSYSSDHNMITNNANDITRNNLYIEYNIAKNEAKSVTAIADQTGNGNNVTCYNMFYDRFNKRFDFDGYSTYGEIDFQNNVNFPLTIDCTLRSYSHYRGIIYFDRSTATCLSFFDNEINVATGVDVQTIVLPSDFSNGTIHNIVISYTTLSDFKVYVDGVEQELSNNYDGWNSNSYGELLGKRNYGGDEYFYNGTLYELTVYNGAVTSEQAATLYNNSVIKYH